MSSQLIQVKANTDTAVYFGQGYVTAKKRLWQLDLSRRIASGRLSEIFGSRTLESDKFQRRLELKRLAERDERESTDTAQASFIAAYVDGINSAMASSRFLPLEFYLLGCSPEPFSTVDCYLTAHLKFFVNSTWRYKTIYTEMIKQLSEDTFQALFSTYYLNQGEVKSNGAIYKEHVLSKSDWNKIPYDAISKLQSHLDFIGLGNPDTGSNAFAINGKHTEDAHPILACDPHMGHVNPGFNMLFRLKSDEGLNVFGANFPGAPGVYLGRNQYCAWAMVGLMADNQDLYQARIDPALKVVNIGTEKEQCDVNTHLIKVHNGEDALVESWSSSTGKLVYNADDTGLFLQWPALTHSVGDICLNDLNKSGSWESFRTALSKINGSPMATVYADRDGNIGMQTFGMIPLRRNTEGGPILSATNPDHEWVGFVGFDVLPVLHNPPGGIIVVSNQFDPQMFPDDIYISNRWHPPTRANRISNLIQNSGRLNEQKLCQIQDDYIDEFSVMFLRSFADNLDVNPFLHWNGDTQETSLTELFDRWLFELLCRVLENQLSGKIVNEYINQWPMWRWNLFFILSNIDCQEQRILLNNALTYVLTNKRKRYSKPETVFLHTLGKQKWLAVLLNKSYKTLGGNRETVHTQRFTMDFLASGQAIQQGSAKNAFGPAFKFVISLNPDKALRYVANTPTSFKPWSILNAIHYRRWRTLKRYQEFF